MTRGLKMAGSSFEGQVQDDIFIHLRQGFALRFQRMSIDVIGPKREIQLIGQLLIQNSSIEGFENDSILCIL